MPIEMAIASGHFEWPMPMDMAIANGHFEWPMPMDMAIAIGHLLQWLAMVGNGWQ